MAGHPPVNYVAYNRVAADGASGTVNITIPAAVAIGDYLVLGVTTSDAITVATPSGWTSITSLVTSGSSPNCRLYVFTKFAVSADTGGSTAVGLVLSGISSIVALLTAHRGVNTSSPINNSASATTTAPTLGFFSIGSLTSTVADCAVLAFTAQYATGSAFGTTLTFGSLGDSADLINSGSIVGGTSNNSDLNAWEHGIPGTATSQTYAILTSASSALAGVLFALAPASSPTPPANDNFANTQVISGPSGSVSGSLVGATFEPSEPFPLGSTFQQPVPSIWFSWTAPLTGVLEIDTCGSVMECPAGTVTGLDTTIAVYTGASLSSLTLISPATDPDNCPGSFSFFTGGTPDKYTGISVTVGTTYQIQIAGFDPTQQGDVTLSWLVGAAPPPIPTYTSRITAAIYNRLTGALIAQLPSSFNRKWQDELNAVGSGECSLMIGDPAVANIPYRSILLFSIDTVARFASLVERKQTQRVARGEEVDEIVVVSGRGNLAVFEEAVVYPEGGLGQIPFSDTRFFNWTSIDFDDSTWIAPFIQHAQGAGGAPWGTAPSGWPDPTADWIWGGGAPFPGYTPPDMPPGNCYFRTTFSVGSAQTIRFFFTVDDGGDLALDGVIIGSTGNGAWTVTWTVDAAVGSGVHTVAIKGVNGPDGAGVLLACYAINPDGTLGTLLLHTDSSWKTLAYPAVEPGFTPGRIINVLLAEAQSRGTLNEAVTTFTDTLDTAGNAWAPGSFAFQVGLDYASVLLQLTQYAVDVRMLPSQIPTLQMYAPGSLGVVSGVSFTPGTNLGSLSVEGSA